MHYQTEVQLSQVKHEAYLCCSDMGHISTASDKIFAHELSDVKFLLTYLTIREILRVALNDKPDRCSCHDEWSDASSVIQIFRVAHRMTVEFECMRRVRNPSFVIILRSRLCGSHRVCALARLLRQRRGIQFVCTFLYQVHVVINTIRSYR